MQFSNFPREKVARRCNSYENDARGPYNLHRNLAAVAVHSSFGRLNHLVTEVAMARIWNG